MFSITDTGQPQNCEGRSRRDFLRVGALGLGGLSLADLLAHKALAAKAGLPVRDKSVVLLFLTGGPSQIETFDPKMTAPADTRSVTGEVKTSIPGVTFGGTFPLLAQQAHRMAVVRSFTHSNANHTGGVQDVMRGRSPTGAGMGSLATRARGSTYTRTGIPTHIDLGENETDPQFDKERLRLLEAAGPGQFGVAFKPFQTTGDGPLNQDLKLNIPRRRLDERRSLRRALDQHRRRLDAHGERAGLDTFEQQAYDIILGKARDAFDLSKEDPRLVRRYDTSRFNTALRVKHRASTVGKQLLLARRLCEAGCGFVTIHNPGWDMHGGNTQFNLPQGMEKLGRPIDQAVAAFLEDVAQRGLSEKILLVITGEFGRTPKVKSNGGRDHWPRLSTLAFAGGGLKMGQVIGESDRHAAEPAARPVHPRHLMATIMHTLFDIGQLRVTAGIPKPVIDAIAAGEPIEELV